MFDNASRAGGPVASISASIQADVIRKYADEVLEEIPKSELKRARDTSKQDWNKISNLIQGLGHLFKAKMLSEDSERRVFSFAFQNEPGDKIERLLELAIAEGYLMKGHISRKEGTGRRTLYVLTRRLAPAFNLDVSSYAGYLSLTSERVNHLIEHGSSRANPEPEAAGQMDFFELADGSTDDSTMSNKWVFITPEEAGL